MKKITLYGASGHGKVVAEIAEELGFMVETFVDEDIQKKSVFNYPITHILPDRTESLVISIGNNKTRKNIATNLAQLFFPILIHPAASVSKRSSVGSGSVLMAGVVVNANVTVGKHCIINTNASVDHDCILEDFVHISPNVAVAGEVQIGEGTHIGVGACVIPGVKIGKWCTIGAGAVILKDVPDGTTVVGNPGRKIR